MKRIGALRLGVWALLLALASLAGSGILTSAQGPNRVAIVVQYADGSVSTHCVTFGTPQITGLEALQATGLDVVYEGGALGARVCKIGPVGCDLPGNCFCQCKGQECLYWSYWHLVDGTWQYAIIGAAGYQVAPGSVEGWSWGIGTPNRAPQPPVTSFEQVCAPPTAAAPTVTPSPTERPTQTSAPSPTAATSPTGTARPTGTPMQTATRAPTREQPPSPTPTRPALTSTAAPTHTPRPLATQQEGHPIQTPTPVPTAALPAPQRTNYAVFGVIVLALLALGAYVLLRRR